ncbi:MAG TPA: hypothetical protein DEA96_08765 [Leptospiraceae bacterium]|nr:hypothetical protein [Spirochaetaceae bacterium]HBS05042.1 hypothetical protein [Leptospiraceae bacterium]
MNRLKRRLVSLLMLGLFAALPACYANYYVERSETASGEELLLPQESARPLNVCLVNTYRQDEIRDLLLSRGHLVTVLDPETLEPLESDRQKKCDVVALMERFSYEAREKTTWVGEIAAGFTFFSLGIIPSRSRGYVRYTYQIIDTRNRSNERIQTELAGYIWWSSLLYLMFNAFQQAGQYGSTRLEMNLKVVSAIESMGQEGKLRVD